MSVGLVDGGAQEVLVLVLLEDLGRAWEELMQRPDKGLSGGRDAHTRNRCTCISEMRVHSLIVHTHGGDELLERAHGSNVRVHRGLRISVSDNNVQPLLKHACTLGAETGDSSCCKLRISPTLVLRVQESFLSMQKLFMFK